MTKSEARLYSKARLQKSSYRSLLLSSKIKKYLKNLIMQTKEPILFYMPLKNEPHLISLMNHFRQKNRHILLPFMEDKSLKVVQYRGPLVKKNFGVREPKSTKSYQRKFSMAIVPVLGFDSLGGRIGFGKGFYDRFFSTLTFSPLIIFVQLVGCFFAKKITENHDIHAQFIITSQFCMQRTRLKNDRNTFNYIWSSRRQWCRRISFSQTSRCFQIPDLSRTSKGKSQSD